MYQTLILPGFKGSPAGHWQRFWVEDHPHASILEQEDWDCPVLEDWQHQLDKVLSRSDGVFLVAHSLGCLLAASYARRALSEKIRGALLVAPCSLDVTLRLHPCMIEFGDKPLARLPFPSLVVGSLNDPYMNVRELERHVKCWGSDLATIGFAGHINVASGFGRWEEGYGFFERLTGSRLAGLPRRFRSPVQQAL